MGVHYNVSPINPTSLVYYVDFANTKSYPGSGTNLSGLAGTVSSTYNNNTGALVYDGTTRAMKRATLNSGTDLFRTSSAVLLGSYFTMQVLARVSVCHSGTANGILTNHSHASFSGAGITIKDISATDFRISCNTGTGTARTYMDYYGGTNIYNKWALLSLRFMGTAFTLWVNGAIDYTGIYSQYNDSQPIDLFNWSTSNSTVNNYRPACEISMAAVYNRALTDDEIKQSFINFRGRYGL